MIFLKDKFDEPHESEHVSVSKLYPPEKSWTKSPAWWNEIPVKNLKPQSTLHLLCESESGEGFHYLCVPVDDIENFRKRGELCLKEKDGVENIVLHLSARSSDLFQDLRGDGKINFGKYLQTPVD